MKEQLQKYLQRIDAMTLRERVIMFLMATVLLLYLVNALVLDPLYLQQTKLAQQIQQDRNQAAELRAQIEQKIRANSVDPDAAERARLRELTAQYQQAKNSLVDMQKSLIAPERMPSLLEDILRRNGRLRLISLRTLPVAGLSEAMHGEAKAPADKGVAPPAAIARDKENASSALDQIYRHGVEITVQGSYADMVSYMAGLEALPWQLFWSRARLSVEEYPQVTLTLTLFTLSLDKKWLNL